MLDNRPERWDLETDLIAVGSGIGGLSAAIAAHELGAAAIVLERSDKVGGVTALSMGEVWVAGNHHARALGIEDSPESGFRYLKRLSMDYGDDLAILNKVVHAAPVLAWFERTIGLKMGVIRDCPDYYYGVSNDSVSEGRMLEVEPFPAASLGDWQERTRVSPQMPYALTHQDIFEAGGPANVMNWPYDRMAARLTNDERCLGPGLAGNFVKGVLDRGIPMLTGFNVEELIADGSRVVGVRGTHEGKQVFVHARQGVVVAVSSYERNAGFNRTMSQQLEVASMVIPTVDGANFRLTGPLGARVAKVPDITSLGFPVPGEEDESGLPLWRGALQPIGLPHTIVVNRAGKRFGNESFYRQIYQNIDAIDGATQEHPNFPCWAVIDSQARAKYAFGSVMPGQDLPSELAAKADTLADLARQIGVDAAGLEATVARFNEFAAKGQDPDFGRGTQPWSAWMCGDMHNKPHPNLGTVAQAPFFAVRLHRLGGSAIAATGVLADHHCRAVGWDNLPIAGLYVAGNTQARMDTGAMMQSGISNARGMVHGWLAAHHAAGQPSDLLEKEAKRLGW